MALGEAAGVAAALALRDGVAPRSLDIRALQARLIERGAVLVYLRDCAPGDPAWPAAQRLALQGLIPEWELRAEEPLDEATAERWTRALGVDAPEAAITRGDFLAGCGTAAGVGA